MIGMGLEDILCEHPSVQAAEESVVHAWDFLWRSGRYGDRGGCGYQSTRLPAHIPVDREAER